MKERKKTVN